MKIMIMAQHYAPEEVSGAVLATELAEDLKKRGHLVTFVTSAPSYPLGKVFPGYHNHLYSKEKRNDVQVIRTWSYISPKKQFWARIFNFGSFCASALFGGMFAEKPDILFSYSPPLPLGLSAWLLSRIWNIPWVLRVEDLYPDAAVSAGLIQNRLVIRFFSALEYFLYKKADHISVISEGFQSNLLGKKVPGEKISVEPVWADPNFVLPLPKENQFRKEWGLQNKFVLLYTGNLGQTTAMDEVLVAADILRFERDIRFLIVGEGICKERLMQDARHRGLENVQFLPYQPRNRFPEILASADVGLVTLNSNSANFSLPSKTFNIMASGRAVLSVSPEESEIARLVKINGCGVNVAPGDGQALAKVILSLRGNNCLNEMGCKGRAVLEQKFSKINCLERYETMICSVIESRR